MATISSVVIEFSSQRATRRIFAAGRPRGGQQGGPSAASDTLGVIERQPSPMTPEQLAETIAAHAADKKAIDVVELDVRGVLGYTDFFLVCSGNTARQTKGIHDGIHQSLKDDHGILPRRVEGVREATWILMDYLDVVVHIFTPEARDFYRLEQLWGEVPSRAMDPVSS
jgi:ribosome-associated protein